MSDALPFPPRPNLEQYKRLAKDLQRACRSGDPGAIQAWASGWIATLARLRRGEMDERWHDRHEAEHIARRWHEHRGAHPRVEKCLLADAQFFIAREHEFASWLRFAAHIDGLTRKGSSVSIFERAVDAIVTGDLGGLEELLRESPRLSKARSTREHRSTLLHYVSANGVEDFRQRTPKNIVDIAKVLLRAGAEVNAESNAYGGGSTALGLTATSIHPKQAGVQIELLEALLAHGARIDQPGLAGNQHSAILGCLANGQGEAARFFADRGAHMTLVEAAGVGRLDVVKRFFDEHGILTGDASQREMDEGFLYACGYGHADVARHLLGRGVDVGLANDNGQTGLHWAMYGPHLGVIDVLVEHGAPVNATDDQQATPLNWGLHGWACSADDTERARAAEALDMIVRAGGKLALPWFEGNVRRQRSLAQARANPGMRTRLGAQLDGEVRD